MSENRLPFPVRLLTQETGPVLPQIAEGQDRSLPAGDKVNACGELQFALAQIVH